MKLGNHSIRVNYLINVTDKYNIDLFHLFCKHIEPLLCTRHFIFGRDDWALLKEGHDLVMEVEMIF